MNSQQWIYESVKREPSPIDEGILYKKLMKELRNIKHVAHVANVSEATIRQRLILLKLSPEDQKKVHVGKMTIKDAFKILKNRNKS